MQIPIIPEAILDEPSAQPLGEGVIAYRVSTSIEPIRDFYQETLTAQNWEWIYTDMGESLVTGLPTEILAQEYQRDQTKLAVVAIDGSLFGMPSPSAVVMAAMDVSSENLMAAFTGGHLMAAYDILGQPTEPINPKAMRFISTLLQFNHPADWFPTQQRPFSLRTDIEEGSVNIFGNITPCIDEVICFINFTVFRGSNFSSTPITILIHPNQVAISLEDFDVQKWVRLVEAARQPADPRDVQRFEDLVATNSLELTKMQPLTLRNNILALQRVYRWRQVKLSTPLVSSYTLFKRNDDTIIEFHTDFTEEEWTILGPSVQQTILGIEIRP